MLAGCRSRPLPLTRPHPLTVQAGCRARLRPLTMLVGYRARPRPLTKPHPLTVLAGYRARVEGPEPDSVVSRAGHQTGRGQGPWLSQRGVQL